MLKTGNGQILVSMNGTKADPKGERATTTLVDMGKSVVQGDLKIDMLKLEKQRLMKEMKPPK